MGLTYAPAHRAKSLVFPPQWKIPWIRSPHVSPHFLPFETGVNNRLWYWIQVWNVFRTRKGFLRWPETEEDGRGEGGSEEERKRFCGGSDRGNPSFLSPCSFFSSIQFPFSLWFFTLVRLPVKCLFRIWKRIWKRENRGRYIALVKSLKSSRNARRIFEILDEKLEIRRNHR